MSFFKTLKSKCKSTYNIRSGVTRIVWLIGPYAVKFPHVLNGWHNFIIGLHANLCEDSTWTAATCVMEEENPRRAMRELLCPVRWRSWGRWLLVMQRCERTLSKEEWQELDLAPWEAQDLDGDDKANNYAWLSGRIVRIDYGHFAFVVKVWCKKKLGAKSTIKSASDA